MAGNGSGGSRGRANNYIRNHGFDAGWQAGRCFDWEQMNKMPQYYGFDRSKIFDSERESFEQECDAVASWGRK